ncbi:MAG: hypothetical protein K2X38_16635 [Gemmataceae bacterium]|nr:hypothetical protein [Gemmataceae bacterium]
MRLMMLFALAGTMVLGAYGVWKYAKQPSFAITRNVWSCACCNPSEPVSADPNAGSPNTSEAIEPIVVMPEATTEEPFDPRVAGTSEESSMVDIPFFATPRFDGDGDPKQRMPKADESFDWTAIRRRLEERSVLLFFDPLPVLPMPERIMEESEAPPH